MAVSDYWFFGFDKEHFVFCGIFPIVIAKVKSIDRKMLMENNLEKQGKQLEKQLGKAMGTATIY